MPGCTVYLFIITSTSLSAVTGQRWLWESRDLVAAESRQAIIGGRGSGLVRGNPSALVPPPLPGLPPPTLPVLPRPNPKARELGFRAIRNRPSAFPRFNREFSQFGKPPRGRPALAPHLQPPLQPSRQQPTDGPIPIVIRPLELDISKLPLENSAHELAPHQLHPPFPSVAEVLLAQQQVEGNLQGVDLDGQASILRPASIQASQIITPIDAQLIKGPHPDALISVPDISVLPLDPTSTPAPDISKLPLQAPGEENSFPFQHALPTQDVSSDDVGQTRNHSRQPESLRQRTLVPIFPKVQELKDATNSPLGSSKAIPVSNGDLQEAHRIFKSLLASQKFNLSLTPSQFNIKLPLNLRLNNNEQKTSKTDIGSIISKQSDNIIFPNNFNWLDIQRFIACPHCDGLLDTSRQPPSINEVKFTGNQNLTSNTNVKREISSFMEAFEGIRSEPPFTLLQTKVPKELASRSLASSVPSISPGNSLVPTPVPILASINFSAPFNGFSSIKTNPKDTTNVPQSTNTTENKMTMSFKKSSKRQVLNVPEFLWLWPGESYRSRYTRYFSKPFKNPSAFAL